jgi:hypothetical protein
MVAYTFPVGVITGELLVAVHCLVVSISCQTANMMNHTALLVP